MRYFAQFILLFLLSASIAFASIGHISALNGDVSIVRNTKTIKAKAGSELEKSDVVKSSVGSVAQLVFNDKTIITVGSNT
ncbi:MAG: hypothetical protein PHE67_13685, partial [Campylobacterales bacterium]|nr:hypothetical protein [Campylobacterales bacterium]